MGRKSRSSPGTRVEVVSGRSQLNYAAGSNNVLAISPNSVFPRLLAMADVFQFYRFKKLRIQIPPSVNDVDVYVGYAPGAAFDTPPANGTAIIELPQAVYHSSGKSIDTYLNIGMKELMSNAQIPWFKTIPGTPATQFEIQGNLYTNVGASGGITLIIEYTVEFQSWNLAAQSPLRPSLPATEGKPEEGREVVIGGQKFKLVQA